MYFKKYFKANHFEGLSFERAFTTKLNVTANSGFRKGINMYNLVPRVLKPDFKKAGTLPFTWITLSQGMFLANNSVIEVYICVKNSLN